MRFLSFRPLFILVKRYWLHLLLYWAPTGLTKRHLFSDKALYPNRQARQLKLKQILQLNRPTKTYLSTIRTNKMKTWLTYSLPKLNIKRYPHTFQTMPACVTTPSMIGWSLPYSDNEDLKGRGDTMTKETNKRTTRGERTGLHVTVCLPRASTHLWMSLRTGTS